MKNKRIKVIGLILLSCLIVGSLFGCSDDSNNSPSQETITSPAPPTTKKWTHPKYLSDNISSGGTDAFSPQVAVGDNGDAVIVWLQTPGGLNEHIFMSEYRNGAWTHPADLSDNISLTGNGRAYSQVIAMDNNGNAIIVWKQSDGTDWDIFMSEYRNGVWTHPADLSDYISPGRGALGGYGPEVSMDNNGNAIIVWEQYDGNNEHIFSV